MREARIFLMMNGRGAVCFALRLSVLAFVPLVMFGSQAKEVSAQSSALREMFEEAVSAVKESTVQQPFADDADQQADQQGSVNAPQSSSRRGRTNVAQQDSETLPPPRFEGKLPLAGPQAGDGLQISQNEKGLITLIVRDKSLSQVLSLLAQTQGLNIVASNDIDALISITLRDVPLEAALTAILSVTNYTWVKRDNIILITSLTGAANLPAEVQGRQIQVFDLDFAKATIVAESITGFLSPIGKVSVNTSSPDDNRLTRELVVVEDLPESLARIAAYIDQVDQPPRQVLIEAHILQVTLDDTNRQGVDFAALFRIAGSNVNILSVPSLAVPFPQPGVRPDPTSPALLATLSGGDLDAVIELLQTTTDSKTLGSPKLLVLNEQEARLQVGEQLGFKVTTTTETSTLESVQFLDVGVVLSIIPRITRDCKVLLHVKPEVSTGQVNPETGLPEEETTELETDIMLNDGEGMVIGGLIKEIDSITQSKVPYLGDVKGLGWFFRRSEVIKERVEIIVALIPRIQPYNGEYQAFEQGELVKAGVPLLHGPLLRTDRPWDPVLPDGKRVTKPLIPKKYKRRPTGHFHNLGPQYEIPPQPLPRQRFYEAPCDELTPQMDDVISPEELLPMPEVSDWSPDDVEIITDQQ